MTSYTSRERVMAAMAHRKADRVPFFLLFTMHGARELGLSLEDYFRDPRAVAEGQRRLRARYGHDCLYGFTYAAAEIEAWGGEALFRDDGPPDSAMPIIGHAAEIQFLEAPRIEDSPTLRRTLDVIERLKSDDVITIGVVMSPFSLPVMQLGFERYLLLLHEQPHMFERLMKVNQQFCAAWANAQLAAGADVICYFDPVSSPTIVPRETYLRTGHAVACATIAAIKGPTVTAMGSGRCLPIVNDLVGTRTRGVSVGPLDDLAAVRAATRRRLVVVGNLNTIEMSRWTPAQARAVTLATLAAAGTRGGFVLCDGHGELPLQVSDDVLAAIADAVCDECRVPCGS